MTPGRPGIADAPKESVSRTRVPTPAIRFRVPGSAPQLRNAGPIGASPENVGAHWQRATATKVGCLMAAKFEIRSPKAGQFRWVLTSQGRTLATGETYSRRVSAEKAIDSL